MANIFQDRQWYVAELVQEINVEGQQSIIHISPILVEANFPKEAYKRAIGLGQRSETVYQNTEGKLVTLIFRGLRYLNVVVEGLTHGAVFFLEKRVELTQAQIEQMILPKKGLGAFRAGSPVKGLNLGDKIKRMHYPLSELALVYSSILHCAKSIWDIQMQIPLLPITETLMIAEALNILHPFHPKMREYTIMTTDFLVVLRRPDGFFVNVAIEVRPTWALDSKRTQEKLEIKRQYWQTRNIVWKVMTEADLPTFPDIIDRLLIG